MREKRLFTRVGYKERISAEFGICVIDAEYAHRSALFEADLNHYIKLLKATRARVAF